MNLPGLEWLPRSDAVNLLAGAFLLSALVAVARRRTAAAIGAYAWNSRSLAGIALVVAIVTGAHHILIAALLVLAVKGFVIPALLRRALASSPGEHRAEEKVRVPTGLLICGALVVIGFNQTRTLFGPTHSILSSCLPVSVATALTGMYLMVSRRTAVMQVVGLVIVENAIFLSAVSLTYGMPLVVEMGVLLDVMVGVALLGFFVGRIEESFESADTTLLTSLKG